MTENAATAPRPTRLRIALRLLVLAAVLSFLYFGTEMLLERFDLHAYHRRWGMWLPAVAAAVFVLLLAFPYVPGMELGLAMMMVLGTDGVMIVYGSTLVALSLSYFVGRTVDLRAVAALLAWLHLRRAHALVVRLDGLSGPERLDLLLESSPGRLVPFLLRHRYLAVALVLNLPGNAVIGGGGGIALLAGVSGIFSFPRYFAAVAVAILPLPLMFLAKHATG